MVVGTIDRANLEKITRSTITLTTSPSMANKQLSACSVIGFTL